MVDLSSEPKDSTTEIIPINDFLQEKLNASESNTSSLLQEINIIKGLSENDLGRLSGQSLAGIIKARRLLFSENNEDGDSKYSYSGISISYDQCITSNDKMIILPQVVFSYDLQGSSNLLREKGPSEIHSRLSPVFDFVNKLNQYFDRLAYIHADVLDGDGGKMSVYTEDEQIAEVIGLLLQKFIIQHNQNLVQNDNSSDSDSLSRTNEKKEGIFRAAIAKRSDNWLSSFNISDKAGAGITALHTPDLDTHMANKTSTVEWVDSSDSSRETWTDLDNVYEEIIEIDSNEVSEDDVDSTDQESEENEKNIISAFTNEQYDKREQGVRAIPDAVTTVVKFGQDIQQNSLWEINQKILDAYGDLEGSFCTFDFDPEKNILVIIARPHQNIEKESFFEQMLGINYGLTCDDLFSDVSFLMNQDISAQVTYNGGTNNLSIATSNTAKANIEIKPNTRKLYFVESPNVIPPKNYDSLRVKDQFQRGWYQVKEKDEEVENLTIIEFINQILPNLFDSEKLKVLIASMRRVFQEGESKFIQTLLNNKGSSNVDDKLDGVLRMLIHHSQLASTDPQSQINAIQRQEAMLAYQTLEDGPKELLQLLSFLRVEAPIEMIREFVGFEKDNFYNHIKSLKDLGLVRLIGDQIMIPAAVRLGVVNDEGNPIYDSIETEIFTQKLEDLSLSLSLDEIRNHNTFLILVDVAKVLVDREEVEGMGSKYSILAAGLLKMAADRGVRVPNIERDIFNEKGDLRHDVENHPEANKFLKVYGLFIAKEFATTEDDINSINDRLVTVLEEFTTGEITPTIVRLVYEIGRTIDNFVEDPNFDPIRKTHCEKTGKIIKILKEKSTEEGKKFLEEYLDRSIDPDQLKKEIDFYKQLVEYADAKVFKVLFLERLVDVMVQDIPPIPKNKDDMSLALNIAYMILEKYSKEIDYRSLALLLGNTVKAAFGADRKPIQHSAVAILYALRSGDTQQIATSVINFLANYLYSPDLYAQIDQSMIQHSVDYFLNDDNPFHKYPYYRFLISSNLLRLAWMNEGLKLEENIEDKMIQSFWSSAIRTKLKYVEQELEEIFEDKNISELLRLKLLNSGFEMLNNENNTDNDTIQKMKDLLEKYTRTIYYLEL